MKEDYYEILGISKGASSSEIKKAYRKKAIEFHPDKNPGDKKAEANFKKAAQAYEILSDPQKKSQYDQFGHSAFESGGFGGGASFGIYLASNGANGVIEHCLVSVGSFGIGGQGGQGCFGSRGDVGADEQWSLHETPQRKVGAALGVGDTIVAHLQHLFAIVRVGRGSV